MIGPAICSALLYQNLAFDTTIRKLAFDNVMGLFVSQAIDAAFERIN